MKINSNKKYLLLKDFDKSLFKFIFFVSFLLVAIFIKYYFEIYKIKINPFFWLFFLFFYIAFYFYIKWDKIKLTSENKSIINGFVLAVILFILYFLCVKYFNLKNYILYIIFFILFIIVLLYFFNKYSEKDSFIVKQEVYYKTTKTRFFLCMFLFVVFIIIAQSYALKDKKVISFLFFLASLILLFFILKKDNIKENTDKIIKPVNITEKDKVLKFIIFSFSILFFLFSYFFLEINNIKIFIGLFLIAAFLFGISTKNNNEYSKSQYNKIVILQIILLFLSALYLRIYKLISFPVGIVLDEMTSIVYVLIRLFNGIKISFITELLSLPSLHFEIMSWYLKFVGFNLVNLRIFYGVLGAFVIVFIYIISKELFNNKIALISSLFYLFMYPAILFSRIAAATWYFPVFFITGMVAFLILGFKYNKIIYYVLTGVFCGLSIYCYHPGKFSIVYLFFLLLSFISINFIKNFSKNIPKILIILLSFFIITFPFIFYLLQDKNNLLIVLSRINNQSIFNYNKTINIWLLLTNSFNYFLNLFKFFVNNGLICSHASYFLPYEPIIDKISSFFLLIGIGVCLFNIKKIGSKIILISFILSLFPHLFSIIPPAEGLAITRILISFPFVAILSGIGFVKTAEFFGYMFYKYKELIYILFIFALFPLIMQENYFKFIKNLNDPCANFSSHSAFNDLFQILSQDNKNKITIFSNYFTNFKGNYFIPLSENFNININKKIFKAGNGDISEIYNDEGKDVYLILDSSHTYLIDLYKYLFPDIEIKKIWNYYHWLRNTDNSIKFCYEWEKPDVTLKSLPYKNGQINSDNEPYINFIIFKISYKNIDEIFCLNKIEYKDKEIVKKEKTKKYIFNKTTEATNKIIYRGYFYAPVYEKYSFFTKDNKMKTYIDGKEYSGDEYISEGLHKILFLKEINSDNEEYDILWINPFTKKEEKIPEKYFYSKGYKNNITVKYYNDKNKLLYIEKVAKIDMTYSGSEYYIYKNILKNLFCTNTLCDAKIKINQDGEYNLAVETAYDTELFVDNNLVFKKTLHTIEEKSVKLNKGIHKIKIKSIMCPGPYSTFRLVIKQPNDFKYKPVSYYDYM